MSPVRAALLAGVGALALAGFPQFAAAKDAAQHVMTVQLPDGQIEQIQYTGDVAPRVVFAPEAAPMQALVPVADMFGANSPFAALQAMSAQMDHEMAGLMHQVEMMSTQPSAGPAGLTEASFGQLPPGVTAFQSIVTMTPNGVCTRTVKLTGAAEGVKPRMVSETSGACGSSARPAEVPAAAVPTNLPHTIQVKDTVPVTQPPTWRG